MPSSVIARIAYKPDARDLDVTFIGSGRTYTYIGVAPEVYDALRSASSKGQYFNARIRNRYPFRRGLIRQNQGA